MTDFNEAARVIGTAAGLKPKQIPGLAEILRIVTKEATTAETDRLRRRVKALESRLARVLRVGARRENALRYDTGAPEKGNVWSKRRSRSGGRP